MRPIDADALVEVLKDWRGDKEDIDTKDVHDVVYYQAMSRAIRIADGAPTIDVTPKWISVKDRLPPEGKFVNVAGINKWTGEIELIPFVAWLLDGEWMCEDAEQQLVNQHGCTVTYWSEIPELPKEG